MNLPGIRSGRIWRRNLSAGKGFSHLRRVAPDSTAGRLFLVWTDLLIVNVLFYFFIRSLIFYPLAYTTLWQIFLFGLIICAVLYASHGLVPWQRGPALFRLSGQAFCLFAFSAAVTVLSTVEAVSKGTDWSWLRPEVIKVPLWLGLFIPLSPVFTALFVAGVSLWIVWALQNPKSRYLPILPTLAAVALSGWIIYILAPFQEVPAGETILTPGRQNVVPASIAMFAGPMVLFALLLWARWFPMAFRVVPLMFHMTLMLFHYTGVLPGPSLSAVLSGKASPAAAVEDTRGVSILYPPAGSDRDPAFLFLRKMVVTGERTYVNYGPTCGLYEIRRDTGEARRLLIPGTMRDIALTPDGRSLYGLNWYMGYLLSMDLASFSIQCSMDLFANGLRTPYHMILDGERLFISNVTPPMVAELARTGPWDRCAFRMERSMDLHRTGYLPFSDGVYGMYLDRSSNRLYAIAGFMEDGNVSSLVEIDVETLTIRRSLDLTASDPIFPLQNRHSVLVPSHYTRELHEVSLDRMEIVRTLRAGPNIVSLEHDPGRGLFYALSRAAGCLLVIDDASGETIRRMAVGQKPEPLWFDREADQLLIGSSLGILKIKLEPFLDADPPGKTVSGEPAGGSGSGGKGLPLPEEGVP